MAVDEAILTAVAAGQAPPTLRVYGWQENWLSLGSAEPAADLNLQLCRRAGIGIVRRASGGTAVLHYRQLAYTLVLPDHFPQAAGSIYNTYAQVSRALLQTMASLGVSGYAVAPAEAAEDRRHADKRWQAACLGSLIAYEILHEGRKIVGNAQVRRRGVVMQHGVVLLDFDAGLMARVLAAASSETERKELQGYLKARVGSLRQATGTEVDPLAVATAMRLGFERAWEVDFQSGELTSEETALADGLAATKYAAPSWTFRR